MSDIYKMFISSDSDGDYTLSFTTEKLHDYSIVKRDCEFEFKAYYYCNEKDFITKLISFFENFNIHTNKDYLRNQFIDCKNQLLIDLNNGILKSQNWFGGNQDLMVTFLKINQTEF